MKKVFQFEFKYCMLSLMITKFIFMMYCISKLFTVFFVCSVIAASSVDILSIDEIIKIVTIPDLKELDRIIKVQQQVNSQSSPRQFHTSKKVRDALFPAYLLFLTCKRCYTINRELLSSASVVNKLYEFLPAHSAIFLFPKVICYSMVSKYYPDTAKDLLKALYSENLVGNSVAICNYVGNMSFDAIVAYKFHPTLTMGMLLERIIECTLNCMKNRKDFAVNNCVAVIDYICLQEKTDLRICGMNNDKENLARRVFDLFNGKYYHNSFHQFSAETQRKIKESCDINGHDHLLRVMENKLIIKDLVEAYLPPLPGQNIIKHIE
jgi:hypothetical protein